MSLRADFSIFYQPDNRLITNTIQKSPQLALKGLVLAWFISSFLVSFQPFFLFLFSGQESF